MVACCSCESWMSGWVKPTHCGTLDRLTREEHAIADGRSVASGCIQPLGWIRRRERCRASVARSDLSAHGFGKNLGTRGGADLPLTVVRDGVVDPRRESLWAGRDQPGTDCPGGSDRFAAARGAGHGQHRDPGVRAVSYTHLRAHETVL